MVDASADVGKFSCTESPLSDGQIDRMLRSFGLIGKPLGSGQDWPAP
ncbi:hypothetical protein MITS9504_03385 [Synechococcus sp. MIT S9504]|nr:hypothetical protein MITS9504_03385 [Synechococcus sp. MIT S9504]